MRTLLCCFLLGCASPDFVTKNGVAFYTNGFATAPTQESAEAMEDMLGQMALDFYGYPSWREVRDAVENVDVEVMSTDAFECSWGGGKVNGCNFIVAREIEVRANYCPWLSPYAPELWHSVIAHTRWISITGDNWHEHWTWKELAARQLQLEKEHCASWPQN